MFFQFFYLQLDIVAIHKLNIVVWIGNNIHDPINPRLETSDQYKRNKTVYKRSIIITITIIITTTIIITISITKSIIINGVAIIQQIASIIVRITNIVLSLLSDNSLKELNFISSSLLLRYNLAKMQIFTSKFNNLIQLDNILSQSNLVKLIFFSYLFFQFFL